MSHWSTKSTGIDRDYIVIRHIHRGFNGEVYHIKFREGYAVAQKNGKQHNTLRKFNMLIKNFERPLEFLSKLKFINRARDVDLIYGKDVYRKYIDAITGEEKKEAAQTIIKEVEAHKLDLSKCQYKIRSTGKLCKHDSIKVSPSSYCSYHIFSDPQLERLGIKVPGMMTKDERVKEREALIKRLERIPKKVLYGEDTDTQEEDSSTDKIVEA